MSCCSCSCGGHLRQGLALLLLLLGGSFLLKDLAWGEGVLEVRGEGDVKLVGGVLVRLRLLISFDFSKKLLSGTSFFTFYR